MIKSTAPTRIDLAGGTLDIWPLYFQFENPPTLNAAINIYATVELTPRSDRRIIVESKDLTVKTEDLFVKECFANGGPHMKRFRAASMGRISRLNKPTAHLTVIVSDEKNKGV